jgi:hypothetical protein
MFILGACHTMGRVRFEQHKGFILLCEQRQILDRLAQVEYDPAGWLDAIERYATAQAQWIEYFHWMKQLVGSYLVARKLSDYGESFLEARITQRFPISDITSPNISSFAGFTGPSLVQVLGNGACFIMRELVRNKIIVVNDKPHYHEHCYVPHARTRKLLAELGCQGMVGSKTADLFSKEMYSFVCKYLGPQKATFNRCFDMPFYFLAYLRERSEIHRELFGRTLMLKPRRWSEDGDFVTLSDGRRIPRWWLR